MDKKCVIEELSVISDLKTINKNYYLSEYTQEATNERLILLENELNSSLEQTHNTLLAEENLKINNNNNLKDKLVSFISLKSKG